MQLQPSTISFNAQHHGFPIGDVLYFIYYLLPILMFLSLITYIYVYLYYLCFIIHENGQDRDSEYETIGNSSMTS